MLAVAVPAVALAVEKAASAAAEEAAAEEAAASATAAEEAATLAEQWVKSRQVAGHAGPRRAVDMAHMSST